MREKQKAAPKQPMRDARKGGIGVGMRRLEDRRLTQGKGAYGDDLNFPGQVYLAVLRSPYPHAEIRSIDVCAALELSGVLDVLTGQDAHDNGIGNLPSRVNREAPNGEPNVIPPYPILALERVRHIGEGVVAVVAETLDIAKDALELIEVEYDALDAVTDAGKATGPDAPLLWPEVKHNVSFIYNEGDQDATAKAIANAHHVTTLDFTVSRVSAAPMEPRTATGLYESGRERYTLYSADQAPHILRNEMAELVLRISENDLRVVTPDCGGAFGMKFGPFPEQALVLWAARRLERPVKWISDRSEAFLSDPQARDNISRAELALDENGKFLALRITTTVNLGAYLNVYGIHTATNNIGGLAGTYTTPHIAVSVRGVYTNTLPTSAYRGAGRPEASYAIERIIDVAAGEMGFDRIELRRRNLIAPEQMPFKTGLLYTYDSGDFETNMDRVLELSDWSNFEERRLKSLEQGKLRGVGLASVIEIAGGPLARPFEEFAEIRFNPSGLASVLTGTASQGQGHETAIAQFVSEFLGLRPSEIRISFGDTDQVMYGRGAGGSRTASAVGAALKSVSDKIVAKGKLIAAHMLDADVDEVEFNAGVFQVTGTNRYVEITEIARMAFRADLLPLDVDAGLSASSTVTLGAPTFPNGCHVCEVEIERATGVLDLLGYWVVDDIGRVVNPLLVKGQLYGGIAQGLGQVIGEEIRYDPTGQLLTASFQDYFMPKATNLPRIVTKSNEVPATTNALGIKGVGEAGTVGALPAGMNAINHALSYLGARHFDMPATQVRLWNAIQSVDRREREQQRALSHWSPHVAGPTI